MKTHLYLVALLTTLSLAAARPVAAQAAAPPGDERVAALKTSLQQNQARLRSFEWIETTIISLKGEEKARQQKRCYYGADGKLQKLPIETAPAAPAPQPSAGGRRAGRVKERVVEHKKEDLREYMQAATALVHRYVPPDPAHIQKAKDAGTLALRPSTGGGARLEFSGYLQPGDRFTIDLDGAANRLVAIAVGTYLEKPDEPVTLAVKFATLEDGTSYPAQTTLDAPAKSIRVQIENSGYRAVQR